MACAEDPAVNTTDKTHGTDILLKQTNNIKKASSAREKNKQRQKIRDFWEYRVLKLSRDKRVLKF